MKNKLFALSLIVAAYTMPANAQIQSTIPDKKVSSPGNVPARIFRILSVNFVTDSTINHPGNQGTDTYITETFTYIGSGVVSYTNYETTESAATRSYPNGILSSTSPGTITLSGGGTEIVHMKKGSFHSVHTLKVVTNTPNQVTSNTVGY